MYPLLWSLGWSGPEFEKVQLWHWFSWSLVLPIPSLASWKLGWTKKQMVCFLFFIINKAMLTCFFVGKIWVGISLENFWTCKKTQESPPRFFTQKNSSRIVETLKDENHGVEKSPAKLRNSWLEAYENLMKNLETFLLWAHAKVSKI